MARTITYAVRSGDEILHSLESCVETKFNQYPLQSCIRCFSNKLYPDSLNDVIAKGRNNMNKLVEIVLRRMTHLVAFHTDIQKMYNSVKLRQEDWCYQRYIWQQDLDPSKIPD